VELGGRVEAVGLAAATEVGWGWGWEGVERPSSA
jgi:hypothetical protein